MTFSKILCPTDFSDGAGRALDLAIRLAIQDRAELVIAHAWELPVFAGEYTVAPHVLQQMADDARLRLDKAVQLASQRGVAKVSSRYVPGLAWRAIVDLATDDRAIDLVVVGTHGRTGLRRVLLGSVAERVVRLSPTAVLAVHPDDRVERFGRVLCPTDFSDPAEHALQLAAQLVDSDARIDLVHVVELPRVVERPSHVLAMARDLEARAATTLAHRVEQIAAPCRIICRTETGHPSEQLLAIVETEPYDLVIVGSHGRTGVKRMILGSIAEKLVRHARCPVLVARTRTIS